MVFKHGESLPEGLAQFKTNLQHHPFCQSTDYVELLKTIAWLFATWRMALQALPVEGEDGVTPHSRLPRAEPAPLEQSAVIILGPTADTLEIRMMTAFVDYLRSVDALFAPRFSHACQ